jgi:hypothetical protein
MIGSSSVAIASASRPARESAIARLRMSAAVRLSIAITCSESTTMSHARFDEASIASMRSVASRRLPVPNDSAAWRIALRPRCTSSS